MVQVNQQVRVFTQGGCSAVTDAEQFEVGTVTRVTARRVHVRMPSWRQEQVFNVCQNGVFRSGRNVFTA